MTTRSVVLRLCRIALVGLCLAPAALLARSQAVSVPLTPDRWVATDSLRFETYLGRPSLYIDRGVALARDVAFQDGTLEYDVAATERTSFLGVVFHAQYLAFMERARTELLNARGIDLARVVEEERVLFLVHEISVKYHRSARLNEMLEVSAEVAKMGRASLRFRQRVERAGELLVEADVMLALVDRSRMRPARISDRLSRELEQALK